MEQVPKIDVLASSAIGELGLCSAGLPDCGCVLLVVPAAVLPGRPMTLLYD
jgi:hypothetical protein